MRKLMIALSLMLAACAQNGGGGGGSSSGSVAAAKPLFGVWTGAADIIDSTDSQFGNTNIWFIQGSAVGCQCAANLSGNETSGTMTISGCNAAGGASCNPYLGTWTYEKSASQLTVCSAPNVCAVYQ